MKKILLFVLIIVLIAVNSFGAQITLMYRDGNMTQGTLLSSTRDYIQVETAGGIQTVSVDEVSLIYFPESSKGYMPVDSETKKTFVYGDKQFIYGEVAGKKVLYGSKGENITDEQLLSEFAKMVKWIDIYFGEMETDHFNTYLENINTQINTTKIQNTAAKVRDFAAGIALNASYAVIEPVTAASLALDALKDVCLEAVNHMTDPKTYLTGMAELNLRYCEFEMKELISDLEYLKAVETQGGVYDMERCVEMINRHCSIFTFYRPSMNLMAALTESGDINSQLESLGKSLEKDLLGKLDKDLSSLFSTMVRANEMMESFEPYKVYLDKTSEYYNSYKEEIPFYSEEFSFLSLLENLSGLKFNTDLSWLDYYKERGKIEEMLTDIQNSNPFFGPYQSPFDYTGSSQGLGYVDEKAGDMVLVKSGVFMMGGTGQSDGKPVHEVLFTYDFYIGKYETTFREYDRFCEESNRSKPSNENWTRDNRPVINVSWNDAIAYCNWLSEKAGLPKAYDGSGNLLNEKGEITVDIRRVKGYRLPTEAEWEYAARGGHKGGETFTYAGSNDLDEVGFYSENSGLHGFKSTQEVGKKKPNALGLYDMSGNVWEWCHDWYGETYLKEQHENPVGPASSSRRVGRGGGWYSDAVGCRVAYRYSGSPTDSRSSLGFRIARTK